MEFAEFGKVDKAQQIFGSDKISTPKCEPVDLTKPEKKHKVRSGIDDLPTHILIPDTQVKPGVPTDHLRWAGQYIVDSFHDRKNIKIIHIGDHWDMPSLSSYDKGKKSMEGRRYIADIEAGNEGFNVLCRPLAEYNKGKIKSKQWWPERHFFDGNHEDRVTRACEADAQLDGLLSLDHMNVIKNGWIRHPFLNVVEIDGVSYSHYFANPMTGKPYGGVVSTRLKTIGTSFTMGHQQLLDYSLRFVRGKSQHGLVAGSFYLQDEEYRGPQGQSHWRGIVICHAVQDGSYDPMFVDLDYLCRRYEGIPLVEFKKIIGLI